VDLRKSFGVGTVSQSKQETAAATSEEHLLCASQGRSGGSSGVTAVPVASQEGCRVLEREDLGSG